MKKILVLISLLVSFSFGMNAAFNFYSMKVLEWVKEGQISIGKLCKTDTDKVDGCFISKEYEVIDGSSGIQQIVVYKDKKVISFIRIFAQSYPPKETEMVLCDIADDKAKCMRLYGHEILKEDRGKSEELEGEAQEFIKKYLGN